MKVLVLAAGLLSAGGFAASAQLIRGAAPGVMLNPAVAAIPCNAAPGTVVSAVSIVRSDGNPATLSLSGGHDISASYTLSSAAPPANVVVAPGGILPADCPITIVVTATQP